MRLSVAAMLLAEASSMRSALEIHPKAVALVSTRASEQKVDLQAVFPPLDKVSGLKKITKNSERIQSLLTKKFEEKESVTYGKHKIRNTVVECDPKSENVADVGILSCGIDEYCVESFSTSLGGICVTNLHDTHRHMQDGTTAIDAISLVCNAAQNTPNLTCETCVTDETAYTGEFACTYTSECDDVEGLCGTDESVPFCGQDNLKAKVTGPDQYFRESCFDITSPIQFSYCDSITIAGEDLTCTQSINGIECNTCTLYQNKVSGGICQAFDCTNTALGLKGNDCTISLLSALTFGYLYKNLPCPDGCSLCGAGRLMSSTTNNFTTDNGDSKNCLSFQLNALTGDFANNDYCVSLTDNVEEACGCIDSPTPGNPSAASSMVKTGAVAALTGAALWLTAVGWI